MLREVPDYFDVAALPPDGVQDAFTYWLQNAVNLPLSLVDELGAGSCVHHGFTPADLIEGADRIDLNLAVADDAVQLHVLARERPGRSTTRVHRPGRSRVGRPRRTPTNSWQPRREMTSRESIVTSADKSPQRWPQR